MEETKSMANFCDRFKYTPIPRQPTLKEYEKCELIYSDGRSMKPSFQMTSNVWAAADNGKMPVYGLYNTCTNGLVVIRYSWETDVWEKIELDSINNLYGLLWKICVGQKEPVIDY